MTNCTLAFILPGVVVIVVPSSTVVVGRSMKYKWHTQSIFGVNLWDDELE